METMLSLSSPGGEGRGEEAAVPDDPEQTCVGQVAYWFTNRDRLGLKTSWPSGRACYQSASLDLLESVQAVLARHRRWSI